MKKKSLLIGIIVFLIIVVILLVAIRIRKENEYKNILKSIGEAGLALRNSDNFYYEFTSDNEIFGKYYKKWIKNDIVVEAKKDSIWYSNYSEGKFYLINSSEKTYREMNSLLPKGGGKSFVNAPDIFSLAISEVTDANVDKVNWIKSIKEIKKENCNDTECYKITYEDENAKEIAYFSANTFLPVKMITYNWGDEVIEVNYNIIADKVSDDDVNIDFEGLTKVEE